MTPADFTRANARAWVRGHCAQYTDATSLAEACAQEFGVDGIGGPLDDDLHWLWDVAIDAKDWP